MQVVSIDVSDILCLLRSFREKLTSMRDRAAHFTAEAVIEPPLRRVERDI